MPESNPIPTDPRFINLTGQSFGFLTVAGYAGRSGAGHHRWHCVCACTTTLVVQGANLKSGHQRSCGCQTSALLSVATKRVADEQTAKLIEERNHPDGRIVLNDGSVCHIDPPDFPLVAKCVWYRWENDGKSYARTGTILPQVFMHTLLMGTREGFMIDHKDGNGLNNRRDNLRWATSANNAANTIRTRRGPSGFRGVERVKKSGRWSANITANGKRRWLGAFDTPEEAARAYDAEAIKVHGEFAKLNFPPEVGLSGNGS